MAQNCLRVCSEVLRKILHRMLDIVRVKSSISDRSDLLLIGKDRKCGVFRILCGKLSHQRCVRTHTVILSVGTDETAVQPDIDSLVGRYHLNLRPGEILFRDSIALVQKLHRKKLCRVLDLLILFVMVWDGADDDVQFLSL